MSASTSNGNSSYATPPEGEARARAYRNAGAYAGSDNVASTDAPVDTASITAIDTAPVVSDTVASTDNTNVESTSAPESVAMADTSSELPPRADRN
jgi:hypothetical protein